MSINNIQLPAFVIAEVFKRYLVEPPLIKMKAYKPEPGILEDDIPFLGDNKKNILVLVSYPGEKFMPEEARVFIVNVLRACQLDIEDIAVVNTAGLKFSFSDLQKRIYPKCIILFGVNSSPALAVPDTPHFTPTEINQISFVSAPSLDSLMQNNAEGQLAKSKLWRSLQQLFKV